MLAPIISAGVEARIIEPTLISDSLACLLSGALPTDRAYSVPASPPTASRAASRITALCHPGVPAQRVGKRLRGAARRTRPDQDVVAVRQTYDEARGEGRPGR